MLISKCVINNGRLCLASGISQNWLYLLSTFHPTISKIVPLVSISIRWNPIHDFLIDNSFFDQVEIKVLLALKIHLEKCTCEESIHTHPHNNPSGWWLILTESYIFKVIEIVSAQQIRGHVWKIGGRGRTGLVQGAQRWQGGPIPSQLHRGHLNQVSMDVSIRTTSKN